MSALPRPYAKNSFAAEKQRSSLRQARARPCRRAPPSNRGSRACGPSPWAAGRPGRVEPEGRLVRAGRGRRRAAARLARAAVRSRPCLAVGSPRETTIASQLVRALAPSPIAGSAGAAPRRTPPAPGCARACTRSRAAREQRVDGDGHDARVQRSEEDDRPVAAVEHQQQHAVLAPQPEPAKRRREPAHALGELAVGQSTRVVDVRDLARARGVRLEQVLAKLKRRGGVAHLSLEGRLLQSGASVASSECQRHGAADAIEHGGFRLHRDALR